MLLSALGEIGRVCCCIQLMCALHNDLHIADNMLTMSEETGALTSTIRKVQISNILQHGLPASQLLDCIGWV